MSYDNAKGSVLRDFKERFKDAKQNQNNLDTLLILNWKLL